jgi:osmotically-inducible protein OsmY
MRRLFVGLAIASIAALSPCWAHADDQQIAQQIVQQLRQQKAEGNLAGFGIDLEVDSGIVWLKGHVANREHQQRVLDIARHIEGVQQVVNDLEIRTSSAPKVAEAPVPSEPAAERSSEPTLLSKSKNLLSNLNSTVKQALGGEDEPTVAAIPASDSRASKSRVTPASSNSQIKRASRSDVDIAREIIGKLRAQKNQGQLRNFDVDVKVNNAVVWISGRTASAEQQTLVLDVARRVSGVRQVVNDLRVAKATPVQTAATPLEAPISPAAVSEPTSAPAAAPQQMPAVPQQMPAAAQSAAAPMPLAFAPARSVAYNGQVVGQPVPAMPAAPGVARARFDHPNMPGYAWPSYAAYPNYAAVTYPRQYSPTAWPYIGPFYPYPQVPLGWRKVTLEWDDGWWMLDFKSK